MQPVVAIVVVVAFEALVELEVVVVEQVDNKSAEVGEGVVEKDEASYVVEGGVLVGLVANVVAEADEFEYED